MIHPYGLIIGIALVVYFRLSNREWIKAGISANFTLVFFGTLTAALVGARLYHVVDYWEYYSRLPTLIPQIWLGGAGVFGGLCFGLGFIILYSKKKHLATWVIIDIFTSNLLITQAIGRMANYFSKDGFWLETFPLLLAYGIGLYLKRRTKSINFFMTYYYLISYGLIRLITDHFRDNIWLINDQLSLSTLIAAVMVVFGLSQLVIWVIRPKADGQT